MTAIAPAITKTTTRVAHRSTLAALRIVADSSAGNQAERRFFALFITAHHRLPIERKAEA